MEHKVRVWSARSTNMMLNAFRREVGDFLGLRLWLLSHEPEATSAGELGHMNGVVTRSCRRVEQHLEPNTDCGSPPKCLNDACF